MVWKLGRGVPFLRTFSRARALTAEGILIKPTNLLASTGNGRGYLPLNGRFGFYVQVANLKRREERNGSSSAAKPRRASVPKSYDVSKLTLEDVLTFLLRALGAHPNRKEVANIGRSAHTPSDGTSVQLNS